MKSFTEFVNENIDPNVPFSVFTQKRNFTNCCTVEKTEGDSVLIKAINQPEGEVRFWLANGLFNSYVETSKVLPRFLKLNLLSPDLKPL
jgi:hypothetical protein